MEAQKNLPILLLFILQLTTFCHGIIFTSKIWHLIHIPLPASFSSANVASLLNLANACSGIEDCKLICKNENEFIWSAETVPPEICYSNTETTYSCWTSQPSKIGMSCFNPMIYTTLILRSILFSNEYLIFRCILQFCLQLFKIQVILKTFCHNINFSNIGIGNNNYCGMS